MIARATKDDIVEVARILAMQVAHFARKYGELQLPDLKPLLSSTTVDDRCISLLRDGTEALVGVLAMVTGGELTETDALCSRRRTHGLTSPGAIELPEIQQ